MLPSVPVTTSHTMGSRRVRQLDCVAMYPDDVIRTAGDRRGRPGSPHRKPIPALLCLMLIQNFPIYPFNVPDTYVINKGGRTTPKMNLEF